MSNAKVMSIFRRYSINWIGICLLWILLTACFSSGSSLTIIETSISPEPIVGKVVTLHIEVESSKDKPNGVIDVRLPAGIKLVDGELEWRGPFVANQVQVHELSICVLQPGEWMIDIGAVEILSETSSWGDSEILNIKSTFDSAEVIPSAEYQITQSEFYEASPSAVEPVEVSPECLSSKQTTESSRDFQSRTGARLGNLGYFSTGARLGNLGYFS